MGGVYSVTWSAVDFNASSDPDDLPFVRVFKKAGSDWVLQDGLNSPAMGSGLLDILVDGIFIHALHHYLPSDRAVVISTFDTDLDEWVGSTVPGPYTGLVSPYNPNNARLVKLDTNKFIVIHTESTDFTSIGHDYTLYDSGWGMPATLVAASGYNPLGSIYHESTAQRVHIFSPKSSTLSGPVTFDIQHRVWDLSTLPLLTVSSPSVVTTSGPTRAGSSPPVPTPVLTKPILWPDLDAFFIGVCHPNDLVYPTGYSNAPTKKFRILMGTPVSAPVWTEVFSDTITMSARGYDYAPFLYLNDAGTKLTAVWSYLTDIFGCVNSHLPGDEQKIFKTQSTDGTTWDPPSVAYDQFANPPEDLLPPIDSGTVQANIDTNVVTEVAVDTLGLAFSLHVVYNGNPNEGRGFYKPLLSAALQSVIPYESRDGQNAGPFTNPYPDGRNQWLLHIGPLSSGAGAGGRHRILIVNTR